MKILIDNSGAPYVSYQDVEEEGIGASERALHEISKYLAKVGHQVYVKHNTKQTMRVTPNLVWASKDFDLDKPDVIIHYRRQYKTNHRCPLIFWSTDDTNTQLLENFDKYVESQQPDLIIGLSKYHVDRLKEKGKLDEYQQTAICGLATDTRTDTLEQKENIAVFMSAPYKGLHVLAKLYPKIKEQCPEWKLCVGGTMRLHRLTTHDVLMQKVYDDLRAQGAEIKLYNRREVIGLMKKAKVMLYPNTYAETYGAAIYDAYAHRCAILTNGIGALPEIIPSEGIVITNKDPTTGEGADKFIVAALSLMKLQTWSAHIRDADVFVRKWGTAAREIETAINSVVKK